MLSRPKLPGRLLMIHKVFVIIIMAKNVMLAGFSGRPRTRKLVIKSGADSACKGLYLVGTVLGQKSLYAYTAARHLDIKIAAMILYINYPKEEQNILLK